ncbi:uncharacterized protein LOC110248358 [Exaiptasia diaphana]|uniref:Uncharacterized protein n=1 Tax=Exaiptasia diaphana TaxID=2652724 RepID=A0A913XVN1_EXADI|nr:uncharacterized protein LOC110248358 [Exaiptasia diaphana]
MALIFRVLNSTSGEFSHWCCGCAALYVDKKHQSKIHSLAPSGGFGKGFNAEFMFKGLKDYSPFLALHTALDFWLALGPSNIRAYITELAHNAGTMLADRWETDTLFPISMYGPMVLIRLPDRLWNHSGTTIATKPIADHIQDLLHYDYGIEVPVKPIKGRLYVRISAHVYNHMRDYHVLADAVCLLVEKVDIGNDTS